MSAEQIQLLASRNTSLRPSLPMIRLIFFAKGKYLGTGAADSDSSLKSDEFQRTSLDPEDSRELSLNAVARTAPSKHVTID